MKFSTSRLTSDRVINVASRTTVTQADDTQLLQELALNLWAGEQQITLEVAHDYGHVSVPQPGNADGPAAEAFVVFLNGNRSHGVVLKTADRRYRLGKMQPGEVGMHDDQTHQRVIHRGGIYDSAPNSKLHQQRVQKPGDSVLGGLIQLLSGGVFGQTPWLPKIPFSYKHHDANVQQHQHPKPCQPSHRQEKKNHPPLILTVLCEWGANVHAGIAVVVFHESEFSYAHRAILPDSSFAEDATLPLFRALAFTQTHASGFRGLPVRTQEQVSRRGFCRVRMLLNMVPPLAVRTVATRPSAQAQIKSGCTDHRFRRGESDFLLLAHALKSQVEMLDER